MVGLILSDGLQKVCLSGRVLVLYLWRWTGLFHFNFFTVSFHVRCPDNISVFEVGVDHCLEQYWNCCYI